jgi:NAD(P)-dependent dehydrogenase (short-subunit alcohol dehydrogenase family)
MISIEFLLDLTDRRAVITGVAQGLGLAIASRLAEAGAIILGADLNEDRAAAALAALPNHTAHAVWNVDVRSAESVARFANAVRERFSKVDIWVNAAGIFPTQAFRSMTEAQWVEMLDVNLKGTFLCGQAAANLMSGGGVIVNISSTSGHRGRGALAHYAASKHGVEGLTRSMAIELGPDGIRVLSVSPALTRTDGLLARRRSDELSGRTESLELERQVSDTIPLGRIGEPDDVAKVVLFAVSDLASFVSGSTILVDGGQLAL